MILQALTSFYETLAEKGKMTLPGWNPVKVSYALEIDEDGELVEIHSLKRESSNEKKKAMIPQEKVLPSPVKKTVGIASNFLYENSEYLLGLSAGEKKERTLRCFECAKELHLKLLEDVDTPFATAIKNYFCRRIPGSSEEPFLRHTLKIFFPAGILHFFSGTNIPARIRKLKMLGRGITTGIRTARNLFAL